MRDEGKTGFLDGMQVAKEHMEHLQDIMLSAAIRLRETVGTGKVCHGLKVAPLEDEKVKVGPGLAFDILARPLILEEPRDLQLTFGESGTLYLVLLHQLRSEGAVKGIPTLIYNDVKIEARSGVPPYLDGAVIFAELHSKEGGFEIFQKGEWYLPRLDHGHSGTFVFDEALRWRYDGHSTGMQGPRFDSGFIPLSPGDTIQFVHGLKSIDLLVQLQARREGVISQKGEGSDFWYELHGDQEIHLCSSSAATWEMELRATIWKFGEAEAGPVIPIADAGETKAVEFGSSFTLDGSRSRAFNGKKIKTYRWKLQP